MKRVRLVSYLDDLLRTKAIKDSSLNGLQVEGPDEVRRVAFAVDARQAAFDAAAKCGAQLLIVHHGLFWGAPLAIVGTHFRRVRSLIAGKVGLYASHLPLDAHPTLGNNAELMRVLGIRRHRPAGEYHGQVIGCGGALPRPARLADIAARLAKATGHPVLRTIDARRPVRRVGCISGGAGDMATQFVELGFDTFVTGEVGHSFLPTMEELGINVIFGGHYATETLGLKALARHIKKKFRLETQFLDLPTEA